MNRTPFDAIGYSDIAALVGNRVPEQRRLEYKRDLPGEREADRKEFLADISSFANADGGDLVYGVAERAGIAETLAPPLAADPDGLLSALEERALYGLQPRIPGLRMKWVAAPEGGGFLVIRIPASPAAPHRVVYAGGSKFFGRRSNGKFPMDTFELRSAFTASEDLPRRLRALHSEAVAAAESESPVVLGGQPRAIVSVVPRNIFREREDIGLTLESAIMPFKPNGSATPLFMLEGILISSAVEAGEIVGSYALTHWRGRADAGWTFGRIVKELRKEELRLAWPRLFEDGLADAVRSSIARLGAMGIEGPWAIFVTILGIKGYQLVLGEHHLSVPAWRDQAQLPDLVIEQAAPEALLPLLRAFWLCFGVQRPEKPLGDQ